MSVRRRSRAHRRSQLPWNGRAPADRAFVRARRSSPPPRHSAPRSTAMPRRPRTRHRLLEGGSGKPSMTWSEAVDEALCVGWIDGVTRRIDERAYQIRFTPRKPTSIWSAVNIRKVHALEADGRMTDAGRAAFARRTAGKSAVYSHERTTPPTLTAGETRTFKANGPAWRSARPVRPGPAGRSFPLDHDGEEGRDAGPAARGRAMELRGRQAPCCEEAAVRTSARYTGRGRRRGPAGTRRDPRHRSPAEGTLLDRRRVALTADLPTHPYITRDRGPSGATSPRRARGGCRSTRQSHSCAA